MTLLGLLGTNAALLIAAFLTLWLVCLRTRDVTPVDAMWALGMVLVAAATFVQLGDPTPRRWLLLGLCAAWGLRLGGYMLWRWRDHGPDRRYQALLGKAEARRGWSFARASLQLVFALQPVLLFVVCLPVQLGQIDATTPLGGLAAAGALLAVTGIAFESIGDWQLLRFRSDPANAGRVMDRGLWRYTRHPNYFGDALSWWGLWLIAAETPVGLWSLPGPLLLTWTLMKWSGAPTIEGKLRKTRPGYADYAARTSGFIPWFPAAAPPSAR